MYFYKKLFFLKNAKYSKPITRLFCRKSIVTKLLVKKQITLYKGNVFSKIYFSKHSLGYKIGEFAFTRKPFSFPKKKKR